MEQCQGSETCRMRADWSAWYECFLCADHLGARDLRGGYSLMGLRWQLAEYWAQKERLTGPRLAPSLYAVA